MIFLLSDDLEEIPLGVRNDGGIDYVLQGLCPGGQ